MLNHLEIQQTSRWRLYSYMNIYVIVKKYFFNKSYNGIIFQNNINNIFSNFFVTDKFILIKPCQIIIFYRKEVRTIIKINLKLFSFFLHTQQMHFENSKMLNILVCFKNE